MCPGDRLDLEQPFLLDPLREDDPPLLWFDEDGVAVPNPLCCRNSTSFAHCRATESIRLYHLNHSDILEQRRILVEEIKDILQKADDYFYLYDHDGDMTAKDSFTDRIGELRRRLGKTAEYSATTRATLMGLRGTSVVAEMVLAEG